MSGLHKYYYSRPRPPTKVALSSIFVVQDTIKQFVETRDLSITIITLATSGSDLYPGHGLYIIAATSLLCDDKMHQRPCLGHFLFMQLAYFTYFVTEELSSFKTAFMLHVFYVNLYDKNSRHFYFWCARLIVGGRRMLWKMNTTDTACTLICIADVSPVHH